MPVQSTIDALSSDERQFVFDVFQRHNFANYSAVVEELAASGIHISRSAAHRAGVKYAEKMERLTYSMDLMESLKEKFGDNAAEMANMANQLALSDVVELMMVIKPDPTKIDPLKLYQTVAKVTAASVDVKVYQEEYKAKVLIKAQKAAEEVSKKIKKAGGLSEDSANDIRALILGIATT
jgi:hypothetical protein